MVAELIVVFLSLYILFGDLIKEYVRKLDIDNDRREIKNDILLQKLNLNSGDHEDDKWNYPIREI